MTMDARVAHGVRKPPAGMFNTGGGRMDRQVDRARLVSLDTVRGFAIVAMIIAHAIPFTHAVTPGIVLASEAILNDVASPLFALVIGATVAINTAGEMERPDRRRFRVQTAIKAIALIVLGLLLDLLEAHVAIVLAYLGATLLVALPLLFLSSRVLMVVTAVLCLVAPPLTELARGAAESAPQLVYPVTPITIALDWIALGSSYRVLGLLPLLVLGILLGRWATGRNGRLGIVLAAGALLFAVSVPWREAAVVADAYTSGSFPDLLRDLGLSLIAYSSIALLVDGTRGWFQRATRLVLRPLSAQGEMALSVYTLQVLVLAAVWASPLGATDGGWVGTSRGWLITGGVLVICAVFAIVWSRVFGTGPLERVIGALTGRHPFTQPRAAGEPTGVGRA